MRSSRLFAFGTLACISLTACRTPAQKASAPLRPDTSAWDQRWWGTDRRVQSGQPELGDVRQPSRHE